MPAPLYVGDRGFWMWAGGMVDVVHAGKGRSCVIDWKASRSNTKGHTPINQNKGSRLVKHETPYEK